MTTLTSQLAFKWVRTLAILLLVTVLFPIHPASAKPFAQDYQSLAKRLPDSEMKSERQAMMQSIVPAASTTSIQDPSFESSFMNSTYWAQYSTNWVPVCTPGGCGSNPTVGPRTGSAWVWFGGIDFTDPSAISPEIGDVYQYVIFPSCGATLQFYLWIGEVEPGADANDMVLAAIDGTPVFVANATQRSAYPTYTLVSVNVSQYADGGIHIVEFYSEVSDQFVNFSLDDIALIPGNCTNAAKGDYNGDRKKDIAVFRPSNGTWYIRGVGEALFGTAGDIPVSGDYNGDGKADIAVFRPSNGTWYILGIGNFLFGTGGDIPIVGDYNGDGKDDVAVFRPSNGTWYVRGTGDFVFGTAGDVPVVGDYDGDGKDDVAVFRPSNGTWYIRGVGNFVYGTAGDKPVVGDYNGDGKDDIAVFRPSNGTWYIRGVGNLVYGTAGDIPVMGDYNGDGKTDIAVFRPSNGVWYILGIGDILFGTVNDIPV